jgi:glutamyl-tRNA reductase
MRTELAVVGLNHKTAPAEVREKVAFTAGELKEALKSLASQFDERVIISTCNRTEVYVVLKSEDGTTEPWEDKLADFLARPHGLEPRRLRPYLYSHVGLGVVRHLGRVASGLDSLVLGEPQILGQTKEAYRVAVESGAVGKVLHRLFHHTFEVVKRVRSETGIGREAASIGSAAVKLAGRAFSDLSDKRALVLGAGDVAELVLKHLLGSGAGEVLVANRNYERAESLAHIFEGRAVRFEDRYLYIAAADVVIVATGAQDYVVLPGEVKRLLHERGHRPLLFIDLSLPRNVDPGVGKLEGVSLYDIDQLSGVVEENMEVRCREAKAAEATMDSEAEKLIEWLEAQEEVVPTIRAFRKMADEIRKKELSKALNKLDGISPEAREQIEYLTTTIVNKLVHRPIVRLKEAAEEGQERDYLRAIQDLFGLDATGERDG